ncbi:MAG: hypothetical protein CVT88_00740 [Candidatus Altiarchaeales archaeon HGW-Altiarchaeales-1]|nr:MAG: hypothetical protein CVT88_00740 [Candidatus Altiarchaeales archaeon HGW-Altiarchaeales-1]
MTISIVKTKEEIIKKFEEEFPYPAVSDDLIKTIEEKIGKRFFTNNIKSFIFEYPYIEKEWREIYSLLYCKTNYFKTNPYVFRIHMINKSIEHIDELDMSSYLGYITVRPLPTNYLSKIVMKPNKNFYDLNDNEKLFVITVNQEVHIGSKKIEFQAFPFFSQDAMVTVCAHADVWMVSNIMHKRYGLDEISIEKIVSKLPPSDRGRNIPSVGLTLEQLAYALHANNWYARIRSRRLENNDLKKNKQKIMEIMQCIDSSIESGIPCILAFSNHVIVIAGHTLDENNNRAYIIFDDSGAHIVHTFNESEPKFSIKVSVEQLMEILELQNGEEIAILCPEFERIYFPLESVQHNTESIIDGISKDATKTEGVRNAFADILKNKSYRILLADSKKLKEFFSENNVTDFNNYSLSHYIWLVEIYSEKRGDPNDLKGYLLLDASAHKYDTKYCFINSSNGKEIIQPAPEGKVMSLLEEFD